MSWGGAPGAQSTVSMVRKSVSASNLWGSGTLGAGAGSAAATAASAGGADNHSEPRALGDVVVPLVLWDRPPRVTVSCMHVAYLPRSQPSQNSNASNTSGKRGNLAATRRSSSTSTDCRAGKGVLSAKPGRKSVGEFNFNSIEAALVDDGDGDDTDDDAPGDDTSFQLGVFVGTVDGIVLYWLFEEDVVVQVNLLIFADAAAVDCSGGADASQAIGAPIQGIASGVDEWGQSTLVSISREGAVARWLLPNGVCSSANATLARELAPVKGLEMFCNNRYAVAFSDESRIMILDTWKMALLYCVDTAQEQIRRSIAVGELKMAAGRPDTTGTSGIYGRRAVNTAAPSFSGAGTAGDRSFPSPHHDISGSERSAQLAYPQNGVQGGASSSASADTDQLPMGSSRAVLNAMQAASFPHSTRISAPIPQVWDSIVISLGTEGLVKCFVWAKPRGVNTSGSSGSQWLQQSCWILSWADDAHDITCSQSTSLKDGDNMNPQTALMRSIKTSYFPVSIQLSPNAAFALCIWRSKWIVLKRKWLCDLDSTTSSSTSHLRGGSARSKPKVRGVSCRVVPGHLVRDTSDDSSGQIDKSIQWEDGRFLTDSQVILWTSSGHAFTFQLPWNGNRGAIGKDGGKFFIFTKDHDQLVPRSSCKVLMEVEKFQRVGYMNECGCCSQSSCERPTKFPSPSHPSGGARLSGFTSCVIPASVASYQTGLTGKQSQTQSTAPNFRLVHTCGRGSVAFWRVSTGNSTAPGKYAGNGALDPVDTPRFFYLKDGFALPDQNEEHPHHEGQSRRPDNRLSLSHLIVARDAVQSSCTYEVARRAGVRRGRRRMRHELHDTVSGGGSTPASIAASVLANALAPVTGRLSQTTSTPVDAGSLNSAARSGDAEKVLRYLLDVPVQVNGYSDGSITFQLLGSGRRDGEMHTSADNGSSQDVCTGALVALSAHRGKVTALAHCYWPAPPSNGANLPLLLSSALRRGSIGEAGSSRSGGRPGANDRLSTPTLTRRGSFTQSSSCLATDKNPFYRSRFPSATTSPATRRSSSSRNLKAGLSVDTTSPAAVPTSASAPSSPRAGIKMGRNGQPLEGVTILVFSGGQDGVLKVIELSLIPSGNSFECEANVIQHFRNHRGAIEQISVSPLRHTTDDWEAAFPDRLIGTVGADYKLVVYAPVYTQNPSCPGPRNPGTVAGKLGLEFECVFEFAQHPDAIHWVEWHLERGFVHVECEDRMVYVWNINTGILERSLPSALLNGGGNAAAIGGDVDVPSGLRVTESSLPVDCSKLSVGDTSVHFLRYKILQCAEHIKASWRNFFEVCGDRDDSVGLALAELNPGQTVSRSPYAIGSIELLLLSFLLSWGASPEIDQACRALLGIDAPNVLHSFALEAQPGAITLPIPWKSMPPPRRDKQLSSSSSATFDFARHWQHSSAMSANLALGIVSLCMNLMEHRYTKTGKDMDGQSAEGLPTSPRNKEEFHVLWSQIITQHSVVLPDYVPRFREPELESLAKFGFDSCEYTQLAARTLLNGVIKRLTPAARSSISAEFAAKLHCELARLETETGSKISGGGSSGSVSDSALVVDRLGSLVILLSMIGTCYPGEIAPSTAREVCGILVHLLRSPAHYVAFVAAELLTKGLMLFRPHLLDLSSLVCQLLLLDMREKQRDAAASTDDKGGSGAAVNHDARVLASGGSNAALSLLVELGACESAFVLTLLQQEMNSNDRPQGYHECVLLYLTELINTHYLLMFRHLPAVVDTIMCCLDPTKPDRRRRCLPLSTRCLQNLVRRFPMVDFHRETQRLAVGTMEAVILIYDLRTATKWRVLDGHSSAVSAVSFRTDGQILVSYAAREGSVRWWNSGNAGLFGGMLKMHQSCLKEHKLDVLTSVASAPALSGGASADLKQVIQTCRFHFLALKVSPESPTAALATAAGNQGEGKTKTILRLTREDASQVQFLL